MPLPQPLRTRRRALHGDAGDRRGWPRSGVLASCEPAHKLWRFCGGPGVNHPTKSGDFAGAPGVNQVDSEVVFEVRSLTKTYRLPRTSLRRSPPVVTAVRHVSFDLVRGESLGLVGESGSGKTALLGLMLGLERPDSGAVTYNGTSLRRDVQVVFQDPASALDPRMRVADIVLEPLRVMRLSGDHASRPGQLLAAVGLPAGAARRYPHEFSGGQRQRIAIARALAPRPRVLLADQPVSPLPLSLPAPILNL